MSHLSNFISFRPMPSRPFLQRLFILCLSVLCSLPMFARAQGSEEAAWKLWDSAVQLIKQNYFKPMTEAEITSAALEELIKNATGAAAKLTVPKELGANDEEIRQKFREQIRKFGSMPGPKLPLFEHVEHALFLFCKNRLDGFSAYQTTADTLALADAPPGGILMQVESSPAPGMKPDGKFYCRPRDGGPAKRAGVNIGDELVSINGQPLAGLRLPQITLMLRGPVGVSVKLDLRGKSGQTATLSVVRELFTVPRCKVEKELRDTVLSIPNFTNDTIPDLKAALAEVKPGSRLVLNLRGNIGGDPQLAADAAGLLALGKVPVAKYVFQGKEEVITSREDAVTKLGALVIRQDGLTASSSELLVVLLQEAMPDSIIITGDPSFGKGEFQQTDSIQDAGRISLTRGSLVTMKGNSWDKKPIQPTLKR